MPKFRKKPVVVDAEQWLGPEETPNVRGVRFEVVDDSQCIGPWKEYYVVTAHNQRVVLVKGDWVIAEPDDRGYYPCKPDIFQTIYEPEEK